MRLAVVVLALAGCGRIGFSALSATGAGDAANDAPAACTTWSPFSTPQLVPALSSADTDWEPALAGDANTIVLSRQVGMTAPMLIVAHWTGAAWTTPMAVPTTLSASCNFGAAWNAASTRLYCSGYPSGTPRLFAAGFDGVTASAPALVVGLESLAAESPTLSTDERELFYTIVSAGNLATGTGRATRATVADAWTDEGAVPQLNPPVGVTGWPTLSGDGLSIFLENSPGDIVTATRAAVGAPFGLVTPVAELNTAGHQSDPEISRDGTTMYFASDRGGAGYDVFVSTRTCM